MKIRILFFVCGLLFVSLWATTARSQNVAAVSPAVSPNEMAQNLKGIWEMRTGGSLCQPCTLKITDVTFDGGKGAYQGQYTNRDGTIDVSGPITFEKAKLRFSFNTKNGGTQKLTLESADKILADFTRAMSEKTIWLEYRKTT